MCRKKKIKCDGKMPACTHCLNYKTECVFTQVEKKRNPPKGSVQPLPNDPWYTQTNLHLAPSILRASRTVSGAWSHCSDFPDC
jgi:Fungal Zn(2)-Cys(6) binuclear cluster domain